MIVFVTVYLSDGSSCSLFCKGRFYPQSKLHACMTWGIYYLWNAPACNTGTYFVLQIRSCSHSTSQQFLQRLQFSPHTFPVYLVCRMDENYNILPHGVNFQDAIFLDTTENRRTFSSLFQFSNCTQGSQPFHTFSPEWETQEDNRVGQHSRMSTVWMSKTKPIKKWALPCGMNG